jgi:hypothetical protein
MRKEDKKKEKETSGAEKAARRKYTVMDRLNFVDAVEEENYLRRMQEANQALLLSPGSSPA